MRSESKSVDDEKVWTVVVGDVNDFALLVRSGSVSRFISGLYAVLRAFFLSLARS